MYAIDAVSGEEGWVFTEASEQIISSPTVVDGTVYTGSDDDTLYAVDATTGEAEWSVAMPSAPTTPSVVEGTVYVSAETGSATGTLFAIDTISGDEQWRYTTAAKTVRSSPTVVNGICYLGLEDTLTAIDVGAGTEAWTFTDPTGDVWSSATLADETVYVGSQDGTLYAVDAESGREEWTFQVPSSTMESSPTVADGTVFIGTREDGVNGTLYAVDASSGTEVWSFDEPSDWVRSSPTVYDGTVYIGSKDETLYAVDSETGTREWQLELASSPVDSSPTVVANPTAGSSIDSRVLRGTLGHHHLTRGESANLSVPVELYPTADTAPPGGRLRLEFTACLHERRSLSIGFERPEGWEIEDRFDDGGNPSTRFGGLPETGWSWDYRSLGSGDIKRPWIELRLPDDEDPGERRFDIRATHTPPLSRSETVETSHSPPRTEAISLEVTVEDPSHDELDVEITETSDPVYVGETLEVTAEIENEGHREVTQDVRLVVGSEGEKVDSRTKTVSGRATETITFEYEVEDAEDNWEYPIRVETRSNTAERAVLVHDHSADHELAVRPGTRVRFDADIDPDAGWTTVWHFDGEPEATTNMDTNTSSIYYDYVTHYEADYWSHEFESAGTHEVTAYAFSDRMSYENGDFAAAEPTVWQVTVTEDGMVPPSITAIDPDPSEPLGIDPADPYELSVTAVSPDSELDRAIWTTAYHVLEFQQLEGNRATVTQSVGQDGGCQGCSFAVRVITEDGLTVSSAFWGFEDAPGTG